MSVETMQTTSPVSTSEFTLTSKRRAPRKAAGVLGGVLLLAGCTVQVGTGGNTTSAAPNHISASATIPAPEIPHQKDVIWDGRNSDTIKYPGRVALPNETCKTWSITNPQPTFVRDGKLFAIIDARRSIPPNCNYLDDSGAAAYKGASYLAEKQGQPEGTAFVPDGSVVHVTEYTMGQRACNDAGTSPIWAGFVRYDGDETNWSPVINLGGSPTQETLQQNNIPLVTSSFANTVHANC